MCGRTGAGAVNAPTAAVMGEAAAAARPADMSGVVEGRLACHASRAASTSIPANTSKSFVVEATFPSWASGRGQSQHGVMDPASARSGKEDAVMVGEPVKDGVGGR